MIDFKEKLKGCFRMDKYFVYDRNHPYVNPNGTNESRHRIFEEFFVIGGGNCVIQHANLERGVFYVQAFEQQFSCQLPMTDEELKFEDDDQFYSAIVKYANKLRELMIVYDYCIGQLRKIEKVSQACKHPFAELKGAIEEAVMCGEYDDVDFSKYGITKKLLNNLTKKSDFLAYARKLEWDGIISMKTLNRFKTLDGLNAYIKAKDLFSHPEGVSHHIVSCNFGSLESDNGDYLANIRPIENMIERYQQTSKLKSAKVLKQAEIYSKEREAANKHLIAAYKLAEKQKKIEPETKEYQELESKIDKSIDKYVDKAVHIPLFSVEIKL